MPMATFKMTCSCGDAMEVVGSTREEAVSKLTSMMNESTIAAHFKEKHPGQPVIPVSQVHGMIEKNLVAL